MCCERSHSGRPSSRVSQIASMLSRMKGSTGMATIRDKMGHSCPNVCLAMALREATLPLSEGSGRNQHPSHSFDESLC